MDFLGGFADFLAKNIFGQGGVFRADRQNKRAKIFQALAIALLGTVWVGEAESTPAPDAAMKDGQHGGKSFTLGAFEENFVEIVFGFEHFLGIPGVVGFFDDGEGSVETRDLSFTGLFGKEARGESFEHGADGVDVAGFFDAERADNWSFIRDDGDQAFGFELAKGFADDGAGDAHHGNQFALDEAFTRVEAAGDDGLAEFVENLATEGRGGFGDGRESGRRAK